MYKYFQRRVWQWILRCDIKKKKTKNKEEMDKICTSSNSKTVVQKNTLSEGCHQERGKGRVEQEEVFADRTSDGGWGPEPAEHCGRE